MILYNPTVSGSLAVTGSLTTTGTITSQTLVVQTITSSVSYLTGSTQHGSVLTNTHQFTGSVGITGSNAALLNINNGVLYVSASGNVGVGGTPTAKLHVFTANNTNSGNAGASFDNQAFVVGTSTSGILMQYDQTNNIGHIGVVTPGVDWRSLVLQSIGGNVLIGTTTNSGYKLQVNGTAFASNFFSATGTQLIQINTWTTFYTLAADQGMYTISIGLGDNDIATWYAYGTIFSAYSRAVFQSQTNGSLVSIRLSGMDVQVLLGSGASFARTLNYKILRS
jgi:hypothetical protein